MARREELAGMAESVFEVEEPVPVGKISPSLLQGSPVLRELREIRRLLETLLLKASGG